MKFLAKLRKARKLTDHDRGQIEVFSKTRVSSLTVSIKIGC